MAGYDNLRMRGAGYTNSGHGDGGGGNGGGIGNGEGGNGGNGGSRDPRKDINIGLLSAFLPGQKAALAQQLAQGFGGGLKQWNGILGQAYQPMQIPQNPLGYPVTDKPAVTADGKNAGDGGNANGGDGATKTNTNTDQLYGWGRAAMYQPGAQVLSPMMTPNVSQGQMQPIAGPAQPQMLGAQPLNPQMIAMLRQRLMGGR